MHTLSRRNSTLGFKDNLKSYLLSAIILKKQNQLFQMPWKLSWTSCLLFFNKLKEIHSIKILEVWEILKKMCEWCQNAQEKIQWVKRSLMLTKRKSTLESTVIFSISRWRSRLYKLSARFFDPNKRKIHETSPPKILRRKKGKDREIAIKGKKSSKGSLAKEGRRLIISNRLKIIIISISIDGNTNSEFIEHFFRWQQTHHQLHHNRLNV